jgi:hypothetical protein
MQRSLIPRKEFYKEFKRYREKPGYRNLCFLASESTVIALTNLALGRFAPRYSNCFLISGHCLESAFVFVRPSVTADKFFGCEFVTARFLSYPFSSFSISKPETENPFSDVKFQDSEHETGDLNNKTGPKGFEPSTCGLKVRRSTNSGSKAY